MFICCIPAIVRKSFVPAVALAGLTSAALFHAVEHAAAREMTRCQVKYSICSEHCIMKDNEVAADSISRGTACIQRTCNHQFTSCARDSGESTRSLPRPEGYDRSEGREGWQRRRAQDCDAGSHAADRQRAYRRHPG